MKYSSAILFGLASSVYAAPTASTFNSHSDIAILQYALTLENLENAFYMEGLRLFGSQLDAGLYANLKQVSYDENQHVLFLKKALGVKAVPPCQYSFPMTDKATFLATAAVLEGVGVSAYLGAAADITNKAYLTAAGSILTTEARHAAILRAAVGEPPVASPYDVPQDYMQVYTLASGFIKSCTYSTGLMAFPGLTVSSMPKVSTYAAGDKIMLTLGKGAPSATSSGAKSWMAAFTAPGMGYVYSPISYSGGMWHTTVPAGTAGQTYVVVTCSKSVTDDNTIAGPAIIEVKEAMS